eukprot:CAMPEP_0184644874 /NCGR_PEP_ID=MMETSP0308-20130426/1486_1 /TAXON_ID=38269 /ORGANISM="Gloeochaete witrockiana, Strain SAG 46.84" /LENGTH=224 /DNA_ID=CAMNT_0027073603 /DNA_START=170 /DNA_END=845 /DNA_ORIENTATION=+
MRIYLAAILLCLTILCLIPTICEAKKDYYEILGVDKKASDRDIKRAYHRLSLKWHPDKVKGEKQKKAAEKKFMEIATAYEVLSDSDKRQKYDIGGEEAVNGQPNPFHQQQSGGFGDGQHQNIRFHQQSGGGGFGAQSDFSDFIRGAFGGFGGGFGGGGGGFPGFSFGGGGQQQQPKGKQKSAKHGDPDIILVPQVNIKVDSTDLNIKANTPLAKLRRPAMTGPV